MSESCDGGLLSMTPGSYPELRCMFIDNQGNVAIAAAHNWKFDDTAGYQTCLIKASIDNRLFKYPEHSDNLPHGLFHRR